MSTLTSLSNDERKADLPLDFGCHRTPIGLFDRLPCVQSEQMSDDCQMQWRSAKTRTYTNLLAYWLMMFDAEWGLWTDADTFIDCFETRGCGHHW